MKTIRLFCGSGGGTKGAFTGGVLEALYGAGISFDGFAGVSTGSLAAGFFSQFPKDEQANHVMRFKQAWFGLRSKGDVRGGGLLGAIWRTLTGKPSLYTADPLWKLARTYIDRPPAMPVSIGTVDLDTGLYRSMTPQTVGTLRSAVIASSSAPPGLPPVNDHVDGGVRRLTPLTPAFELGRMLSNPDDVVEIYMVNASPRVAAEAIPRTKIWADSAWWTIGFRALDIMEHTLIQADVREAERTNELVQLFSPADSPGPEWLKDKIYAKIIRFDPRHTLYGTYDVKPDLIQQFWGHGEQVAKVVLSEQ